MEETKLILPIKQPSIGKLRIILICTRILRIGKHLQLLLRNTLVGNMQLESLFYFKRTPCWSEKSIAKYKLNGESSNSVIHKKRSDALSEGSKRLKGFINTMLQIPENLNSDLVFTYKRKVLKDDMNIYNTPPFQVFYYANQICRFPMNHNYTRPITRKLSVKFALKWTSLQRGATGILNITIVHRIVHQ